MGFKIITPAAPAFTVAQIRGHLRTSATGPDDVLILSYLAAAQESAMHYTGKSIGEQTVELGLDGFPRGAIALPHGPVVSIDSIKYLDTNGVEQTVLPAAYSIDDYNSMQHWVAPAYGTLWPDSQQSLNCVKVRYKAGSLPEAVKSALLLTVGHLYENREDSATVELHTIPNGARALLDTVRIWSM